MSLNITYFLIAQYKVAHIACAYFLWNYYIAFNHSQLLPEVTLLLGKNNPAQLQLTESHGLFYHSLYTLLCGFASINYNFLMKQ